MRKCPTLTDFHVDIVLLFPGQGSQKTGMGKDLAAGFPAAKAIFEQADETLGFPLTRLCFEGPNDELTGTRNAQPALTTIPATGLDLREHLGNIEKQLIRSALEQTDGTVAHAARLLRLQRTTLVEKLRKYELHAHA